MSTTTLTADQAHAAIYALALDLQDLADNLREQVNDYINAEIDRRGMHAGDLATAARTIGNLAPAIDALSEVK